MKNELYFSYEPSQGEVLGRKDLNGSFNNYRGKIILLGREEKIKEVGFYKASLIEKEKCFIAVRVVKQKPILVEEKLLADYYPQVRYFNEKYRETMNLETGELKDSWLQERNVTPVFELGEKFLPYKEEVLAYYEEIKSGDSSYGGKIIRETVLPELYFGNTSEYSWGFYRTHKDRVFLGTTDLDAGRIRRVYLHKCSEEKVLYPKTILEKNNLRCEEGTMAAMGIAAAFGGPSKSKTSNPVDEYLLECEGKKIRAIVKTTIYYDSDEEHVLSYEEVKG